MYLLKVKLFKIKSDRDSDFIIKHAKDLFLGWLFSKGNSYFYSLEQSKCFNPSKIGNEEMTKIRINGKTCFKNWSQE